MRFEAAVDGRSDHPKVSSVLLPSTASPLVDTLAAFLRDYLESRIAAGTRFQEGETILVGSALLRVVGAEDGLALQAFLHGDQWLNDLGGALKGLWLQQEAVRSVVPGGQPAFSTPMQTIARGGGDTRTRWTLVRHEGRSDEDSGWKFAPTDPAADEGLQAEELSVAEFAFEEPFAAQFLALPVGTRVECKPRYDGKRLVSVSIDGQPMQPQPGSLLEGMQDAASPAPAQTNVTEPGAKKRKSSRAKWGILVVLAMVVGGVFLRERMLEQEFARYREREAARALAEEAENARVDAENDAAYQETLGLVDAVRARLQAVDEGIEAGVRRRCRRRGGDSPRVQAPVITRALMRLILGAPAPLSSSETLGIRAGWNLELTTSAYAAPVQISDFSFRKVLDFRRGEAYLRSPDLEWHDSTTRISQVLRRAREQLTPTVSELASAPTWVVYVLESKEDPRIHSQGFNAGRTQGRMYIVDGNEIRCAASVRASNSRRIDYEQYAFEGGGRGNDAMSRLQADLRRNTRAALANAVAELSPDLALAPMF